MPPKTVREVNEPKGPFALDAELIEQLDKIHANYVLPKVQEFDLDFLKDDVNVTTLTPAEIRAKYSAKVKGVLNFQ